MCFFPAVQFTYRKSLGFIKARLAISHHLQKSLNAGMKSYIVQLDFTAFDRVSHSGLLLKFKYIGACRDRVLSICREFILNLWHRVVVDGDTSEWIPIAPGVPQSAVLGLDLLIIYNIPRKCSSWWRTDYMIMQMTPHYWQLFASQRTDLLFQPLSTGTWLEFKNSSITGARY